MLSSTKKSADNVRKASSRARRCDHPSDVIIHLAESVSRRTRSVTASRCVGGEFVQLAAVGGMPTVALGATFVQLRSVEPGRSLLIPTSTQSHLSSSPYSTGRSGCGISVQRPCLGSRFCGIGSGGGISVQAGSECPGPQGRDPRPTPLSNTSRDLPGLAVCSQCAARCRFTCLIMFLVSTSFARFA